MSYTIVIPARMHSTRLPNKPLADIEGKPMIVRVAERARLTAADRIVVATDHPDIVAKMWDAVRESHDTCVLDIPKFKLDINFPENGK